MPVIETARLRLRRMTLDDAAFVLQQVNTPGWLANIGDRHVHSIHDAKRYIRDNIISPYAALGFGMNLVELKSTRAPIGMCGLVQRTALPDPDLGFALLESQWGRGLALEAGAAVLAHAWQDLGLKRVLAITAPDNVRSDRVLRRLGFVLHPEVYRTAEGEALRCYQVTPPGANHDTGPADPSMQGARKDAAQNRGTLP